MADRDHDDALLRTLGAVAAEHERAGHASPWEALARGELSPEEAARLERLATEDPEAARLLDAHRPLGEGARARITAELAAKLAPRRAWAPRAFVAASALAMAAALVLMVTRGPSSHALPEYALDVSGTSALRGPAGEAERAPGAPCVLVADARASFEVVARPGEAEPGAVVARAFVVRRGEPVPWPRELEVSPKGSVRMLEPASALVGATELAIVIGRPEHLGPAEAVTKARGDAGSGPGWQVLRCAIHEPAE
jgi:hypothetical protein